MKTTWNITKKIMHQRKDLPPLNTQNGEATIPEEKSEAFASHLEQTFTPNNDHIDSKFVKETEEIVTKFLQQAPAEEIRKAVPAEIAWQIRHLKSNKAPGPDQIQNEVLKQLPFLAIKQICEIINGIFRLKAYPSNWKEGRILLFPKSGKKI